MGTIIMQIKVVNMLEASQRILNAIEVLVAIINIIIVVVVSIIILSNFLLSF